MRPLCLLLILGVPAAARAETRKLSLIQAIDLAADGSHDVRIAREGIAGARAGLRGARAQRLPHLRAEANLFYWNEELVFSVMGVPLPPGSSPVIRDQITSNASATLIQPITPLYPLTSLVHIQENGVGVAEADYQRTRLDAGLRAAEGYLHVLQASALRDVSQRTVSQLEAQLQRARALEAGGVLGKVDLLRLQSAADSARQGLLRAEANAATAERGLVLSLGLPEATDLDVFDDLPAPPPRVPWAEDEAVAMAMKLRPELRAARHRIEQARGGKEIAGAPYYPNVAGIATYTHSEGGGTFQPKDAWFVGLTLQWDVWEWGKTGAAVDEAAARLRQAQLGAVATADGVAFDVRRRHIDARAAFAMLDAATSGVTAAEEAHRIQSARYEQGAATTTDVLDAETDVARARSQLVLARYDYYLSLVALARAIGETPRPVP